jgi:Ca2+-binding EF-hand superfamily protein
LYDLVGIPEIERKGQQSPKHRAEEMMKQMDKNGDNAISLQEFQFACTTDPILRRIFIDPMFNC